MRTQTSEMLSGVPASPRLLHRPRAAHRFSLKVQETNPTDLKPVYTEDGVTFAYIQVGVPLGSVQFPRLTPQGLAAHSTATCTSWP